LKRGPKSESVRGVGLSKRKAWATKCTCKARWLQRSGSAIAVVRGRCACAVGVTLGLGHGSRAEKREYLSPRPVRAVARTNALMP